MARRPSVAIVGLGRVGGSIGLALAAAGYPIAATWSRSRSGRHRASTVLDAPVLATPSDAAGSADVTFLCVPDDAIADVASSMRVRPGTVVVHTSGATSVRALDPLRAAGARTGSVHPLQTIPDPARGAEALRGAAVAITCEPADRALLRRIATAWGGRPFDLADADKAVYHAAAVFASNYVVASVWAAQRLLESIGLHRAVGMLAPLVDSTVRNVETLGPAKAITGPAVRGDATTLSRHAEAMRDPVMADAYRGFAKLVRDLAGLDAGAIV